MQRARWIVEKLAIAKGAQRGPFPTDLLPSSRFFTFWNLSWTFNSFAVSNLLNSKNYSYLMAVVVIYNRVACRPRDHGMICTEIVRWTNGWEEANILMSARFWKANCAPWIQLWSYRSLFLSNSRRIPISSFVLSPGRDPRYFPHEGARNAISTIYERHALWSCEQKLKRSLCNRRIGAGQAWRNIPSESS